MKRVREGGVPALRTRPRSGRPPKLTEKQREKLPQLLARGAEAYGYRGEVWTTKRVAAVIERQFGVRYHPAHLSRLVRTINWTVQKPVLRATQRNEKEIETWLKERWPVLKKKGRAGRADDRVGR
jgi:transposase